MATSTWTQGLLKAPHAPGLKRLMLAVDGLKPGRDGHLTLHKVRDSLRGFASLAIESGKYWTQSFLPKGIKTAVALDWDIDRDIDSIVKTLGEAPSPAISEAIHEALRSGQGPSLAIRKLEKGYQIDRARDIARTVYMNIYAKSSLREMKQHGYELARRLEINDHKVCPVCKALNSAVYHIDRLLDTATPLTDDSHPRCRGTFIPVINSATAVPNKIPMLEATLDFELPEGRRLENVPIEFSNHLRGFLNRAKPPFSVVFDPGLKVASKLEGDVLTVHPRALYDQDPRELVCEAWAERLWPEYEDKFRNEYILLTHMGLVRPSKTVKTTRDYWISEFASYKLNQLDTPWEVLWFKANVKE